MPLVNFINSDFYIVFQIMMKYQIDGAESAAVELSIYVPFHLCIFIWGVFGVFLWLLFVGVGFLLGEFSHRKGYFYEKRLDKTFFHEIKLK